jgi:transcriptional regulator with XRE-family HTH domain
MSESDEQPHERLDRLMTARSLELRKRWVKIAKEAGVSVAALGAIRRGEYRPSPHTARGIEDALQWAHGSVDTIYAGGDPKPAGARTPEEILAGINATYDQVDRRLEEDIAWAREHAPGELRMALDLIRHRHQAG